MSFDVNQMPGSTKKKTSPAEDVEAGLRRFKYWFVGIVLVCFGVIAGSAIFYYQLANL